jgi:GT2 family glycosyltransferase
MSLFMIVVCHMQPSTIAHSLMKFLMTSGVQPQSFNRIIMVDHHWPIEHDLTSNLVHRASSLLDAEVISPPKNLGGHGGFNFALQALLPLADNDLVLGYDPDSNPITPNWLQAMRDVLEKDPSLAFLSLTHTGFKDKTDKRTEFIAGHRVSFFDRPEMFNVTLWRGSFIKSGLTSDNSFYGQVETPAYNRVKSMGLRHGYMEDCIEAENPILHPDIYREWKGFHAGKSYLGNFDQYCKDKGVY